MAEAQAQKEEGVYPEPPRYVFTQDKSPRLCASIEAADVAEPDSNETRRTRPSQRFWRRAKWSPDGTHLLAQSEAHELDLFILYQSKSSFKLHHKLRVTAPTPLLSWSWYTFAQAHEPSGWCFAMSARDVPIRLVDASSGATRATYGIQNHVERFVGAEALTFSSDGRDLLVGHSGSLSIFDVVKAGTNTCATIPLIPMRNSRGDQFQKGVVSDIAVAPHFAGTDGGELLAVGTFRGCVGIYHRTAGAGPGQWTHTGKSPRSASQLCLAGWQEEGGLGIAHLCFHPTMPYLLFLSLRSSVKVKCYDLRYLATVPIFSSPAATSAEIALFEQPGGQVVSPQKIFFDVSWDGRWLTTGGHAGVLNVWNLQNIEFAREEAREQRNVGPPSLTPQVSWKLAEDAIGCVCLHPLTPLLAVASGARHFAVEKDADDCDAFWHVKDGRLMLWNVGIDTTAHRSMD